MTDVLREELERRERPFRERVAERQREMAPFFETTVRDFLRRRLEIEREEIVESIPWAD